MGDLSDDEIIQKLEAMFQLKGLWLYKAAADRLRELLGKRKASL